MSERVALISGASRGLGLALAGFLALQGYDLILGARGADALEVAAHDLRRRGGQVIPVTGDVTDLDHRHRLITEAEALGRLDLLVNNASELGPTPLPPLAQYPLEALERVLRTNVVAPVGLIQAALPLLQKSRGLVVSVSSDAALGGYPGWGGYGASKAALDLISLTLASELKDRGITVVSVDPGDMRTAMYRAAFPDDDISDRPLPEATLPFWAWLLGQDRATVNGRRFRAQAEVWEAAV